MIELKEWQYALVPVLAIGGFIVGWEIEEPSYEVEQVARALNNAPESAKRTTRGRFSARAEGSTLVVRLDGVPSGNDAYDPKGVRLLGYAFACDGGRIQELLDQGATLSFEVSTNTGKEIPPLDVSECPHDS